MIAAQHAFPSIYCSLLTSPLPPATEQYRVGQQWEAVLSGLSHQSTRVLYLAHPPQSVSWIPDMHAHTCALLQWMSQFPFMEDQDHGSQVLSISPTQFIYVWHFMLFLSIHSSPWRRYLSEPNLLGLDYLYPPNEENAPSSDSNHRRHLQAWTTAQSSPHWPLCLCLLYIPENQSDPCFAGIFTQILQAAALCVQPAQHGAPVPAHNRLATAAGMKGI